MIVLDHLRSFEKLLQFELNSSQEGDVKLVVVVTVGFVACFTLLFVWPRKEKLEFAADRTE